VVGGGWQHPSHFRSRTTEQSLSTPVHEMAHLEQHHFGKPGRTSYHNKERAGMMKAVGLIPSDTGAPAGREVGQKVSHYIEAGGVCPRLRRACRQRL
jgi:predicted SprT family Zn-dependent metalloprotease